MMRKHLTIEPVPGLVHYAAERCVCHRAKSPASGSGGRTDGL